MEDFSSQQTFCSSWIKRHQSWAKFSVVIFPFPPRNLFPQIFCQFFLHLRILFFSKTSMRVKRLSIFFCQLIAPVNRDSLAGYVTPNSFRTLKLSLNDPLQWVVTYHANEPIQFILLLFYLENLHHYEYSISEETFCCT